MPTPTEALAPSANGELVDRVQQLRLDGQLGKGGGGNRGSWLPWVLCGMMAVAWAGVGVRYYRTPAPSGDASGAPGNAKAGGPGGAAPSTGAQPNNTPAAAPGELLLQVKGTLTPFLQINLSPDDVSGTVTEIFFKEGDRVEKGQTLAKLRDDRYRNDYEGAKAAVAAAKARLDEMLPESVRQIEKDQAQAEWDEAEAGRVRAQKEVDRLSLQKGGTIVSQQEIERAEAELRAAQARVVRLGKAKELLLAGPRPEKIAAARGDLGSAEARYREAERMLKNCVVVAPIDGTVLTKVADKGVLVSPMSFNVAAGICSLADLSDLEAEIEVREDQITQVKPGQRCEVAATANPSRTYVGRVDRVMPIADDTKNVIKVRVKVQLPKGEDAGSFLKPKMSTVVRVFNDIIPEFGAKKEKG